MNCGFLFGRLYYAGILITLLMLHLGGNFEVNFGTAAWEASRAKRNLGANSAFARTEENNEECWLNWPVTGLQASTPVLKCANVAAVPASATALFLKITMCFRLAKGWAVRGSNPGRGGFSSPAHTGHEAHPASWTMDTGTFPGVMRPGRALNTHPNTAPRLKK
jgi:hypothetical protein